MREMLFDKKGTARMSKRKKAKARSIERRIELYAAEALVLAAVVAGAILTPQLLFRIKDQLLYKSTELGRLEGADTEFLGSTYEKSMELRMRRFAEKLAKGERFYVAAKNLELTEDLNSYLYSEKGLYQQFLYSLMNLELLYSYFWEYDCRVSQWKQYVVYSDDYGEGISFLLWYIELEWGDDTVTKLLVDGETGSVYGVKTEGNNPLTAQDSDMGGYYWPLYRRLFHDDRFCSELLYYLMVCYESGAWEALYEKLVLEPGSYEEINYGEGASIYLHGQELKELAGNAAYAKGEDSISFQLPYGDAFLEFRLEIGAVNVYAEYDQKMGTDYVAMYPDVTAGIRQLYELIPDFM